MFKELEGYIRQGEPKQALEWILEYASANPDAIPPSIAGILKKTVLQNLARLAMIAQENRLGIITPEDYSQQIREVNWNLIQLSDMIKESRFDDLESLGLSESGDEERDKRIKEADFLDKLFKFLLLALLAISIFHLFRSQLLAQAEFSEKMLQATISMTGIFGSFLGYFKWRSIELR